MINFSDGFHRQDRFAYQITHLGRGKWIAEVHYQYPYGIGALATVIRATSAIKMRTALTSYLSN